MLVRIKQFDFFNFLTYVVEIKYYWLSMITVVLFARNRKLCSYFNLIKLVRWLHSLAQVNTWDCVYPFICSEHKAEMDKQPNNAWWRKVGSLFTLDRTNSTPYLYLNFLLVDISQKVKWEFRSPFSPLPLPALTTWVRGTQVRILNECATCPRSLVSFSSLETTLKSAYFQADINEQLRLTEMTEQFNKWAAQVENDFKDFQKKLTVAEINAELARTHDELVTHFESMAVQLETWDMENQEVTIHVVI